MKRKVKKGFGSFRRSLLAGFLSISMAVGVLPELALPVYANSVIQEGTGASSELPGFLGSTRAGGMENRAETADDSSLPGLRHGTNEAGDVFLGGNYIELGIDSTGSFGTAEPAPESFGSHASYGMRSRVGLLADGDGFNIGNSPDTGDFFLPGAPEECYILGYALNGNYVNNRNAARQNDFWSSPIQAPKTCLQPHVIDA